MTQPAVISKEKSALSYSSSRLKDAQVPHKVDDIGKQRGWLFCQNASVLRGAKEKCFDTFACEISGNLPEPLESPGPAHVRGICREAGLGHYYDMSVRIDEVMQREKGLLPNVDFYSATVYHAMGIPTDLFTPVFAMSRVAGWCAHVLEQYQNNRIYRPRGKYVGPTGEVYTPIDER